eukprot:1195708-Prorocentrum_minimum.AAC.4
MYETACEAQPDNIDLLRGLFTSLIRVDNFPKQQQVVPCVTLAAGSMCRVIACRLITSHTNNERFD